MISDIVCCCVLIITLIVYITHWILDEKRIKKQFNSLERDPHSGIVRVGNQVEDLFRTMTLKEWDKFIKEENDPTIKTYAVFCKAKQEQKFEYQELVNFLREHKDHIDWINLLNYVDIPMKIIEEFKTQFTDSFIDYCVLHQKLSEDFINRYKEELSISDILRHQKVSEKFIEENKDVLKKQDWIFVAAYQKLSEEFIKKYRRKLNEKMIVIRQTHIDRDFILKLYKNINWVEISMEPISEECMRKWKDKLHWTYLCSSNNRNMSDDFIMEMKDYVEWKDLWMSRIMSERIRKEAKRQLGDWVNQ